MGKKRKTNLLITGSKLCPLIGAVWLIGLACHFLGARQASLWLFLLGIVLSAALLGMLLMQLARDRRQGTPADKKKRF